MLHPIFEFPEPTSRDIEVAHRTGRHPYLHRIVKSAQMVLDTAPHTRGFSFDVSAWAGNAVVESGEPVLLRVARELQEFKREARAVLEYRKSDDQEYMSTVKAVAEIGFTAWTLRVVLAPDVIEDLLDPDYFSSRVASLLKAAGARPQRVIALVDFGDVSVERGSVAEMVDLFVEARSILARTGVGEFVLSGSSMPPFITEAVESPDSTDYVLRKEFIAWRALAKSGEGTVGFGDYGVRGPSAYSGPAPDRNGKIRYTVAEKFFVVRGHSMRGHMKGAQMHELASILFDSAHYAGETFSWGDSEIARCARREFKGGGTEWIAIDTSHHVVQVISEMEMTLAQVASQHSHVG